MVVAALALGAAALWGASRLTWLAEPRAAGVRGTVLHTEDGAQAAVALVPLAVLALAGVAGMVATGGWPRRLLGAVLVLAGLAAAWIAVDGARTSGYPAGAPVGEMLAAHGLALVGGLLVAAGGALGLRWAGRMPRLGARYSAPGAKHRPADSDAHLWEALSDGEDPTIGR
ncbi:Trp biosynthesis-associated membrane protein [Amycolatopsis arida]|uniref:Trp biosynthesis-associated membrane protein n=1 Tax=Amycolatopsis arida TaxID=587909 RepID=UPI000B8262C1|nr:Trp biosynthesis-associated membrane protein [Amycolatopsis arida]